MKASNADRYASHRRATDLGGADEQHGAQDFRNYLYALDDFHIADFRGLDARQFARSKFDSVPFLAATADAWRDKVAEPFRGITTDGQVRPAVHTPEDASADYAAPVTGMVEAAHDILEALTPEQASKFRYGIEAVEWRTWSNPEILVYENGLRLEELPAPARHKVLKLVRSSLGDEGWSLVETLMKLNGFLGSLVELPLIMNENSYQMSLFGTPSLTEPWGWQLYGYHIALNVFVLGGHMSIAPVFLGAEPTYADEGVLEGYTAFRRRQELALALVRSLSESQLKKTRTYETLRSDKMPKGRLNPMDERHLGGAFQDNRIIPYEGIRAAELESHQQNTLLAVVDDYLQLYPQGPRGARLKQVRDHLDETYFTWIGSTAEGAPFYFRIQSPVILLEFDHHAGVWLANDNPATFHIHTIMRNPNGNDYGRVWLDEHLARKGRRS